MTLIAYIYSFIILPSTETFVMTLRRLIKQEIDLFANIVFERVQALLEIS